MADPVQAPEYLSQDEVRDLMDKTRSSLVAQFPHLEKNPQFESDLNDAFSNFTKEQLRVGNDVEGSFSKTIHPMIQKWQAQAPMDISSSLQKEDALANRMRASGAASALDVPSMFPDLTSSKSPYRSAWEARMNHDVNVAGRTPRLGATQLARKQFLQDELKRQWQSDALPGMKPNMEAENKIESELSQLDSVGQPKTAASALTSPSLPGTSTPQEEAATAPAPSDFTGTGIFKDWQPHGLRRDSVIEIGNNTLTPNKSADQSVETPPDTGVAADALVPSSRPFLLGGNSPKFNATDYLKGSVPTADATADQKTPAAQKADLANSLSQQHPEWTKDQVIMAVNGQMFGAH